VYWGEEKGSVERDINALSTNFSIIGYSYIYIYIYRERERERETERDIRGPKTSDNIL
jgi:hypothetical protein